MIATSRFVHIHLHKSGGTFVNECLLRFLPDARELGYHLPRSLLPPPLQHLPVLGFVRNPWSYYVSWYAFQRERPQPNALFRSVSDDGRLDFNATITNLVRLGEADGRLDALLPTLPPHYTGHGLNLPAFVLAGLRGRAIGFYSFLQDYMYAGDPARLHIGRMETLRRDLLAFLERQAAPLSPALRAFVADAAPRNTSTHAPYQSYYDARTRDLVGERDRAAIERCGYRFEV